MYIYIYICLMEFYSVIKYETHTAGNYCLSLISTNIPSFFNFWIIDLIMIHKITHSHISPKKK